MVERRQGLRFAVKAGEPFRILRERVGQDLDGDLPTEIGVGRALHFAHASHADLGGDFVRTDAGACSECHATEPA